MADHRIPEKQGLYDPANEHDACGVGFVAHIKGEKRRSIVDQAIEVLLNLDHRGACGCEANTGDGAGILIQVPHKFLSKACEAADIQLPGEREYGVGMVFLPTNVSERNICEQIIESAIERAGQKLLGWRDVPTDNSALGDGARNGEPVIRQVFIRKGPEITDELSFERKLYLIRKIALRRLKEVHLNQDEMFYVASLSARTIVYKGMLLTTQLMDYYADLRDPDMETAIALVHSRFATNTFPMWELAHPYRYVVHNGEINTVRGNENWMAARQGQFQTDLFGDDLRKLGPIVMPGASDSARLDNCLEFMILSGWSLPHAMMMMIPEPWEKNAFMSPEKRAFYQYHSCLMEPWDGPASIALTNGDQVCAVLDRNGLRPSRYYVTRDDLVIMASEVGVVSGLAPKDVLKKGRLQPGRMFMIDTVEGRIIADEELKSTIAAAKPYREWLDKYMVELDELADVDQQIPFEPEFLWERQTAFGYTFEQLRMIIEPMAATGVEARGSMGNDAPLAVLSDRAQLLYNYFKQLFAQVTNPPIDAIREELITATDVMLGPEDNLLEPEPSACRKIHLKRPVVTNEELARLRNETAHGFSSQTLSLLFEVHNGATGLEEAMDALCAAADEAIKNGTDLLVLSDRGVDAQHAAIPALLATGGLHHHLIRQGTRTRIGLVVETGEAREIHHFAVLIGFGANVINPYLAYETIDQMVKEGMLSIPYAKARDTYAKAGAKGVTKVLSKMGISTVQSYCGAQIFEALGLQQEFVDRYFTHTATRVEGIGLKQVAEETLRRHRAAFAPRKDNVRVLDPGGEYQWRKDGERHLFNPQTIHNLQRAVRTNDYEAFRRYSDGVDGQLREMYTLRGLFEFKLAREPIPLDEVESVEAICARFKTGAMSYGSISKEAHEGLAIAMNRIGGKSNTGEGGEDPDRFTPDANGDLRRSAIKQVASGRFGVSSEYLVNADEIQIKMAQGAKPGEGGELPGRKVYPWIAKVRNSTPGVGLISPPPHHDIYSIEDLAELIHDLKNANRHARINVKLVSEVGVGTIAAGVAKGHADVILISGYDGGTGASPQTSIKHAGLPWELGVAETHQTLVLNDLRSRIYLETDGQLKTGRDVVIAALLGAEEFGFSTAPLVALGCIMMRVCQKDTCPVGVATQNPELRKKFTGDPAHVVNFMRFVAQQMREIMAELGFRTVEQMIGRVDRLDARKAVEHWKASGLDFSSILHKPGAPESVGRFRQMDQDHGLEKSLDDTKLLALCRPAIESGEKVEATLDIINTNRVVGTITGSEISRKYGGAGLPEDTIKITFKGSAGQSFAAFMPKGMTFLLEGDANDYFGKGLSGGKVAVYPSPESPFKAEENIIIGNVAFYGATGGEAYVRGVAGERFCVRNSGVSAVVEGVGDHACEYMTGGRVVVLGETGVNFAAGMSGGIAYVLDEDGSFEPRCNTELSTVGALGEREAAEVEAMVRKHAEYTGSERAWEILAKWETYLPKFKMVLPMDFGRAMNALEKAKAAGMSGDDALMAAFRENMNDVHRVSGN